MTRYVKIKVNITEGQKQKLQSIIKKGGCQTSIRLGHEDLKGNDVLAVTQSQAKKIAKAFENGKGVTIRMSAKQLKHYTKIEGGFLGMLARLAASALPAIAKTVLPALGVGALSGLASSGDKRRWDRVFTLKKEVAFAR